MSVDAWLNGERLQGGVFPISVTSETLQFGRGLFETVALRAGQLECWRLHVERLRNGCDMLGLQAPDTEDLTNEVLEILRSQNLKDIRIKLMVFDDGISGVPSRLMTLGPLPEKQEGMVSLLVSTVLRCNPPTPVRTKSTSYLDEWIVQRTSSASGAFDGLMLRYDGVVVEGSRTNLFIESDGEILTPGVTTGLLPGTGRAAILIGAEDSGVTIREADFDLNYLRQATAVWLVNSLRGILEVGELRDDAGGWSVSYARSSRFSDHLVDTYLRGVGKTSVFI